MNNRNSAATERALELVHANSHSPYAAARVHGLQLSTIYRALKRAGAEKRGHEWVFPPSYEQRRQEEQRRVAEAAQKAVRA